MVYSVTEWPRMRASARAAGFDVVAWWSSGLSEREWQDAVVSAGWLPAEAHGVVPVPQACEAWVGQPNHFPYSVVIGRGHAHPWPVWGVLPDTAWVDSLRLRRAALVSTGEGVGQ
jgi:hypothetical protein